MLKSRTKSRDSSPKSPAFNKRRKPQRRVNQRALPVIIPLFLLFILIAFVGAARIVSTSKSVPKSTRLRGTFNRKTVAFNEDNAAIATNHLILVAGHSVTISRAPDVNCNDHADTSSTTKTETNYFEDESAWYLLPYQRDQGLPQAILGHIQAGIDVAREDRKSLLIFSGGETRASMGPITEGASYFRVSDALNLWDKGVQDIDVSNNVRARTATEDFATDSFENLMFSICRFKEITGSYPEKITVASFSFKQTRFESLHARALKWPAGQFNYIGVDPPPETGFNLEQSEQGERENAVTPFETDLYGCNSPVLQKKRLDRNPFHRTAPYELSCPEMKDLFHWCGTDLFPGALPWRA